MLHAMTMIRARQNRHSFLDRIEGHVHRAVADRVNANPVSGTVVGIDGLVEFLSRNANEAAMAGIVHVWL
jgi:hypothetical protein